MALKEYSAAKATKWITVGGVTRDGKKNPGEVEGYYLGRVEGDNKFEPGKKKITYMIQTPQGVVGVNGAANLNIKMEDTERAIQDSGETALNSFVLIRFTGTTPSKKGTPTKMYQVMFDVNNKLPEGGLLATEAPGSDDEADLDDYITDTEEDFGYEAPAAAKAPRSARAEALIAKARKTK